MSEATARPVKVLVTGANGFIGKNLVLALQRRKIEVAEIGADATSAALFDGVKRAKVVYHLAGVNRTDREEAFTAGNVRSVDTLFIAIGQLLAGDSSAVPPVVVLSSSCQASKDNLYGSSKLAAEQALEEHAIRLGTAAVIYRLPGVFGKWCLPNYNSVVATFCYNIARDLPITIADPERVVELVHIDDVVADFMSQLEMASTGVIRRDVGPTFKISIGELAERLREFRSMRRTLEVPDVSDPFTRRLLGTYSSYLSATDLSFPLERRCDTRGTLAELLKSPHFGQIFVSRTHPGVTRGNHVHDVKVEKFCVVEGKATIRFRSILGREVIEYQVAGTDFRVLDIPPGMTHSIENVGTSELIVLFWASEIMDRDRPDTNPCEVLHV